MIGLIIKDYWSEWCNKNSWLLLTESKMVGMKKSVYISKEEFGKQNALYGKWFDRDEQKWMWGVFLPKKMIKKVAG